MSEFNHKNFVKTLDHDKLVAAAALIKAKKAKIEEEPLYKHNFNNDAQAAVRAMTKRYRVHIAGNKVGKTDEFGWECAVMCKGKCEEFGINFPHKPPLKIWYGGRDRNILGDEPLNSITRYLKGQNIDHRAIFAGNAINKMLIWDDNGVQSEIIFKPYNGEAGIWESGNVHCVFLDEEPPRDVFSAVKTKIAVTAGIVCIAMTPDHGLTWTYDLLNGSDPDHGSLLKKQMMEVHHSSTFDNVRNFRIIQSKKWVRYPIEYIDQKEGFEYRTHPTEGYLEMLVPDTFWEHVEGMEFGSNEYKMRILGLYTSFTGKVYPFDSSKHVIQLHDLPNFADMKFFGAFDPGYSDPACYVLIGIDKTNTKYLIDGFYQSYLDARDHAQWIKRVNDYWGVRPEMIVADNQINDNLPQKDAEKSHIQSRKAYYLDELGDNYTIWRTEEMDKRNPATKRDAIVRDMKDGKFKILNHENRMYRHIQELLKLEFGETKDKIKGKDDHFDAAMRMFYGAGITYDHWMSSEDVKELKAVHQAYRRKNEPLY